MSPIMTGILGVIEKDFAFHLASIIANSLLLNMLLVIQSHLVVAGSNKFLTRFQEIATKILRIKICMRKTKEAERLKNISILKITC